VRRPPAECWGQALPAAPWRRAHSLLQPALLSVLLSVLLLVLAVVAQAPGLRLLAC
jgi:hypothetical protein